MSDYDDSISWYEGWYRNSWDDDLDYDEADYYLEEDYRDAHGRYTWEVEDDFLNYHAGLADDRLQFN